MQSSRVPSTVNFTTISPLHSLRRLKTLMLSNMSPIISNLRQRLFYSRPYFIPIVHPSRLYPSRWYVRPDHVQLTDRSHIYYISGTEEPAAAVHFISSPSHPRVPLSLFSASMLQSPTGGAQSRLLHDIFGGWSADQTWVSVPLLRHIHFSPAIDWFSVYFCSLFGGAHPWAHLKFFRGWLEAQPLGTRGFIGSDVFKA